MPYYEELSGHNSRVLNYVLVKQQEYGVHPFHGTVFSAISPKHSLSPEHPQIHAVTSHETAVTGLFLL